MVSLDPIIRCSKLTKTYGQGESAVQALRGIELEAFAGELLMLVGPSGCGKTTLISVLSSLLDADGGECRVLERDLRSLSAAEKTAFRARSIGFVFQAFNLIPTLTAAENVAVPLLIQDMPRRAAVRRATEMLERVGIGDKAGKLPSQLSGGQQQRVAIARAIVHEPRLVVCDEPTSALDHQTGERVLKLLRENALRDGRTLVIVTHDHRIFPYADRIAQMDDGRVVSVQRPSEKSQ
ncbi:MAG: ABC transporter ATP-binding protein [Planctomycetes bacterium]|nr:ABC transporter ATP-binding protein [Planctomycetota bacterium]